MIVLMGERSSFCYFSLFLVICECTILIFSSIQNNHVFTYKVAPIKIIPLRTDRTIQPKLSDKELRQIQQFKFYLDSLPSEAKDSLFKSRPHLLDSLEYLEAIYQKQLKK